MNLVLEKKVTSDMKKPILTEEDRNSYKADKKALEKLQSAYLSTFDEDAKKQEE